LINRECAYYVWIRKQNGFPQMFTSKEFAALGVVVSFHRTEIAHFVVVTASFRFAAYEHITDFVIWQFLDPVNRTQLQHLKFERFLFRQQPHFGS
jgi:hypothetical protein